MDKLIGQVVGEDGALQCSAGSDANISETNGDECVSSISPKESRRLSIQNCIRSLAHAVQCTDSDCGLTSCHKMKRVVLHAKSCKFKSNPNQKTTLICLICKQLIALCCYHAKQCQQNQCPVPYCVNIKHKLREKHIQKMLEKAQFLKRRIASMDSMSQQLSQTPTTAKHDFNCVAQTNSELVAEKSLCGEVQKIASDGEGVIDQISDMLAKFEIMTNNEEFVLDQVCQLIEKVEIMPNKGKDKTVSGASGGMSTGSDLNETEKNVFGGSSCSSRHSKHCQKNKCRVPYCMNIKHKSGQQKILLTEQPNKELQKIQFIQNSQKLFQQNPQQVFPQTNSTPQQIHLSTNSSQQMSFEQSFHIQDIQQLLAVLRSPASPQQQQQVLSILKSNPKLMAAFIKLRTVQNKQQKIEHNNQ